MTAALMAVIVLQAIAVAVLAALLVRRRLPRPATPAPAEARRILFPFVAQGLSPRALNAALRLAAAENATLVPVFLACVSLDLPLGGPLPRQCSAAVPLLEAIEQRATAAGIAVDSRIEQGRNPRHALRQAIAHERFDTVVAAAASNGTPGFDADDIAWLLDNSHGEIVVLRPGPDDRSSDLLPPVGRTPSPAVRRRRNRGSHGRDRSRADEMARTWPRRVLNTAESDAKWTISCRPLRGTTLG
jgi:hypothetical protein